MRSPDTPIMLTVQLKFLWFHWVVVQPIRHEKVVFLLLFPFQINVIFGDFNKV